MYLMTTPMSRALWDQQLQVIRTLVLQAREVSDPKEKAKYLKVQAEMVKVLDHIKTLQYMRDDDNNDEISTSDIRACSKCSVS